MCKVGRDFDRRLIFSTSNLQIFQTITSFGAKIIQVKGVDCVKKFCETATSPAHQKDCLFPFFVTVQNFLSLLCVFFSIISVFDFVSGSKDGAHTHSRARTKRRQKLWPFGGRSHSADRRADGRRDRFLTRHPT